MELRLSDVSELIFIPAMYDVSNAFGLGILVWIKFRKTDLKRVLSRTGRSIALEHGTRETRRAFRVSLA